MALLAVLGFIVKSRHDRVNEQVDALASIRLLVDGVAKKWRCEVTSTSSDGDAWTVTIEGHGCPLVTGTVWNQSDGGRLAPTLLTTFVTAQLTCMNEPEWERICSALPTETLKVTIAPVEVPANLPLGASALPEFAKVEEQFKASKSVLVEIECPDVLAAIRNEKDAMAKLDDSQRAAMRMTVVGKRALEGQGWATCASPRTAEELDELVKNDTLRFVDPDCFASGLICDKTRSDDARRVVERIEPLLAQRQRPCFLVDYVRGEREKTAALAITIYGTEDEDQSQLCQSRLATANASELNLLKVELVEKLSAQPLNGILRDVDTVTLTNGRGADTSFRISATGKK